ncbi:PREDICTED: galectin-4-like [Thamnophis sirtalis]|uniref:Galectin-4-like n=1 Tax=Thamnophis sirtalis TaxID=35019 RepID=A0A6I9XFQ2_9SAUR|nr:PREDICTED: galectin-4-like [Thamnophis sirtalis]
MVFQLMKSYNYDEANADAEYMENGDVVMAKVMNAIGEKGREQVMNALDDYDLQKLTDCRESECGMADFMNALNEEHALEIINALNAEEIGKLMALPYNQPVSGGLRPGMSVYVQGAVLRHPKRFEVNFACGQHDGANIAFQFKVYFNWQKIVLNTFQVGRWGHEEHHEIPFKNDEDFEVIFIVNEAKYKVGTRTEATLGLSFNVDFAGGQHNRVDIPLHFNPRFNQKKVVLNTFQSGRWGREEGHQMPFQKSEPFELIFNVTEAGYQILVNKTPFCTYKHRIPPQSVKAIYVKGDMELNSLNVTEPTMNMSIGEKIIPIIKKANDGKGLSKLMSIFTDDSDGKMTLPYHHPVPGGLRPGMFVYVQGTVPKDCKSSWVNFNVDFACGQHNGVDIPLHFNPRFNVKKVALNTFQSGRWGREEGHQMPFQKGEHFELIFNVTEAGYQILVNKKPFCTYKHKIPPQSVKAIHVRGDLELNSLNVTEPTVQNMIPQIRISQPGSFKICGLNSLNSLGETCTSLLTNHTQPGIVPEQGNLPLQSEDYKSVTCAFSTEKPDSETWNGDLL